MTATHVLIRAGMVDARVCSTGTWDEAEEWLRRNHPAGTQNNWRKNEDGGEAFAPVACADSPDTHKHYMFVC